MLVALTPFAYAQAGMQRRALLSTLGPLLLMMAVAQAANAQAEVAAATSSTTAAAGGATPGAAAAALRAADLPRNPAVACATKDVYAAFTPCYKDGASQHCCSGLQSVYGNNSSAAYGCLCLPPVLYKTILAGSDHNVDVLGLLKSCHQEGLTGGPPFTTQWAGHPTSLCPDLPLGLGPVQMLESLGQDNILAGNWPRLAWGNLQQAGAFLVQHGQTQEFAELFLGKYLMDLSCQVFLLLPLLFVFLHHAVLQPLSGAYRALPTTQRLVTCQHAVYAVVFGVSLIPQTYMACRFLFGNWTGDKISDRLWTHLVAFIMSRCGLYLIEAAVRAVKWSWVLFAHHVIFMALLAQNFLSGNPVLGVIGIVLDLFACHEAPLYAALLAYRLRVPIGLSRTILRGAVAWYVATRVLQTAILGYMVAHLAYLPQINREPAFIATAVMCAALTVIQAYTVAIYVDIDRKLGKQQQHTAAVAAAAQGGGECSAQLSRSAHAAEGTIASAAVDDVVLLRKAPQLRLAAAAGVDDCPGEAADVTAVHDGRVKLRTSPRRRKGADQSPAKVASNRL